MLYFQRLNGYFPSCIGNKMRMSALTMLIQHMLEILASTKRLGKKKQKGHQIRSVAQSCPTLCDPMNRSTPGLPVHHQLPELTQTHVHRVSDAIQPFHPLSSPSPQHCTPRHLPASSLDSELLTCWPWAGWVYRDKECARQT